jgi:hypothetical protein
MPRNQVKLRGTGSALLLRFGSRTDSKAANPVPCEEPPGCLPPTSLGPAHLPLWPEGAAVSRKTRLMYVLAHRAVAGRLCGSSWVSSSPTCKWDFWAKIRLMTLRCGTLLKVHVGVQSCATFGRSAVQVTAVEDDLCAVCYWTCCEFASQKFTWFSTHFISFSPIHLHSVSRRYKTMVNLNYI